ncbi:MAG: hypothetical protein NC336_02210 [Clostridium sp.]|nr:hypothetical protein [Clostridium sp.]
MIDKVFYRFFWSGKEKGQTDNVAANLATLYGVLPFIIDTVIFWVLTSKFFPLLYRRYPISTILVIATAVVVIGILVYLRAGNKWREIIGRGYDTGDCTLAIIKFFYIPAVIYIVVAAIMYFLN